MNKAKIERKCREAGLPPAHKGEVDGVEVIVADGYVSPANLHKFRKLGVEKGEYPLGCYCTIWWIMQSDDRYVVARPIFFEWNHDTGYDQASKKQARINTAMKEAGELIAIDKETLLNA